MLGSFLINDTVIISNDPNMILFSICYLEDKAVANNEEWQTDYLRERQVCIFSLALMIFATPLCVSVEAWLTHAHTHSKTMSTVQHLHI